MTFVIHYVYCVRFDNKPWILNLLSFTVTFKVCFGWIWAHNIAMYSLEFILMRYSAVTSLINTWRLALLADIHVHTVRWGDMLQMIWANSNLVFLVFGLTNVLFVVSCGKPSVYTSEVFTLLWTLTQTNLPPGGWSWSGQLLWRSFALPGKHFSLHLPQLFSVALTTELTSVFFYFIYF